MNKQIRKKRSIGKLVVLNEEELIQQVALRPVLYDRSLKAYRKTSLRLQYWNDVSEAMGATMEECRRRWRSLRDSFAKHYKQIQRAAEENVVNKHRKWIFYDQMSFMIPYLDNPSYELDDHILDEFGDNSDDGQSIACEPVLNTSNSTLEEKPLNNEEHDDSKPMHEHNSEHVQQSTVSVQATDFMPLQEESVVMENHQHHQTHHHQLTNTDFPRHRNFHNNTTLSLQCAETNTDATTSHVMDSDEKFLLSCTPALRRLTNRQNALARLKIQQILFDIEFGQQPNN